MSHDLKKRASLVFLQELLRRPGSISKKYTALVHGDWPEKLTYINQALETYSNEGRERWTKVSASGKSARTGFRKISEMRISRWLKLFQKPEELTK